MKFLKDESTIIKSPNSNLAPETFSPDGSFINSLWTSLIGILIGKFYFFSILMFHYL